MSDVQPIPSIPTTPLSPQLEHSVEQSHKMPVAAKQSLINLSLGMGIMLVALSGGAYLMMTNKEVLLGGKASVDKQSSFSFAAPTQVKPGEQFTVDVMLDTSADPEYTISGADALIQYSFTPDYKEYISSLPGGVEQQKGKGGDVIAMSQPPVKGEELTVTGVAREVQDGSGRGFEVGSGGAGISWEEQQRIKPMSYPEFSLVKTEFGTIFDSYPATPSSFEVPIPGVPTPTSSPVAQIICGGIRGTTCPGGMYCQYNAGAEIDRFYPDGNTRPIADQTGVCVISTKPTPPLSIMCGGIAGLMCPSGFTCQIDSAMRNIPDASGSCVPATLNEKPVSDDNRVLGATTAKSKKLAMTVEPINYLPIEKSPPNPPEFMPPVKIIQGTTSISGLKNYAVDDQGYFKGFTGKGVFARLTFVANTTGKIELKFAYSGETATDDSNINGFIKNVPVNIQKSSERLLTTPTSLQVMVAKPVVILPSPTASASGTPVPFIGLACNEKCGDITPSVQVPPCMDLSVQLPTHSLQVNQNNDIYPNWGGLDEKWFVNEQLGSDRWYYMYKDGDAVRVMNWSSGSGLAQGGREIRADKPVANVSIQCYESLRPGFKFPAPDQNYVMGGVGEMPIYNKQSCAPGLACVAGFCRNQACSDQSSCLCGGSTPSPKPYCTGDADCAKGQECYQPPMPVCKEGTACIQMMPAPYCRQIVLPSGTPSPTPAFTPPPYPTPTPRPANQVSWKTGAALLEADDFEISINRNGTVKKYYARSGDLTVYSDMNPQSPTLELNWTEDGIPMRFFVYFTNLGSSWKVNQIRTYDGSEAGQWLYYKDADITSLSQDVFISPKIVLTSSNMVMSDGSTPVGTISMTNMRLQQRLTLASPTPTPIPIPDKPVLHIALSLQGRSNHETNALVYQVNAIGESLLGSVKTDSNGNGLLQISSTAIKMDPNLRLFIEVPGYLRKYHQSIGRSGIVTEVGTYYFRSGTALASFGMLTAGDLNIGATGFGDHQVNSVDIAEMYTQWSSATEPGTGANANLSGDLNGDGVVNNRDYAIIMMNFGKKSGVLK